MVDIKDKEKRQNVMILDGVELGNTKTLNNYYMLCLQST